MHLALTEGTRWRVLKLKFSDLEHRQTTCQLCSITLATGFSPPGGAHFKNWRRCHSAQKGSAPSLLNWVTSHCHMSSCPLVIVEIAENNLQKPGWLLYNCQSIPLTDHIDQRELMLDLALISSWIDAWSCKYIYSKNIQELSVLLPLFLINLLNITVWTGGLWVKVKAQNLHDCKIWFYLPPLV